MAEVAIRELVLDGTEERAGGGSAKRNTPTFEVVANSGADFAVRRTCGRSSRLWVMLVSQGQYYVRDERTGEVRDLDDKSLASFMSGCGGSVRVGCQWLETLDNDRRSRELLLSTVGKPGFAEAASSGLWLLGDRGYGYDARHCARELAMGLVASHLPLAKSVARAAADERGARGQAVRGSFPALVEVERVCGLDRARRMLDAYRASRVEGALPADELAAVLSVRKDDDGRGAGMCRPYVYREPGEHRPPEPRDCVAFDFEKLCEYALAQSVREGMADDLRQWLATWRDALRLQLAIYGKVVDKYPENLLTVHQRLIFASRDARARVEERVREKAMARLSALDRAVEGEPYLVTHPTCAQDMRDEAAMQHNCLVGYIGEAMSGRTLILFCRRADEPERSHVTLEVSPKSMALVQACARCNREPDDDTMRYLAKWCAGAGVDAGRYAERMRGLGCRV